MNWKRERLFLYWLKLVYEVEPRSGDYREITRFARNSKDQQFFERAAQLNYKIVESLKYFCCFAAVIVCLRYFNLEGTELDFVTFWFFASANCFLFAVFLVKLTKITCCLNLCPVVMSRYFSDRCKQMLDQIETLKSAGLDNAKLSDLLHDFNSLILQMANVNGYFKFLFGELFKGFSWPNPWY